MISIIVAVAEDYAIGRKGDLLCHLPLDLQHFKTITSGHTVLMGKRTFFSLPRHPLPQRRNIVLTDIAGEQLDGAEMVYSLQEAVDAARGQEEVFIIGGGMVYRQFFPLADKLYITHIHHTFDDADTFFPEIKATEWRLTSEEYHSVDADNPFDFTFAEYLRVD